MQLTFSKHTDDAADCSRSQISAGRMPKILSEIIQENMMKTKLLFLLLLILLFAWSCAPVYVPSTHAAPMLEKKDDVHVSAYTGTNGINAQLAYAPTDDIGVQVNALYLTDDEEENGENRERKTLYGEVAFGKYEKISCATA